LPRPDCLSVHSAFYSGVKRPESETGRSPSSAEFKKASNFALRSTHTLVVWGISTAEFYIVTLRSTHTLVVWGISTAEFYIVTLRSTHTLLVWGISTGEFYIVTLRPARFCLARF